MFSVKSVKGQEKFSDKIHKSLIDAMPQKNFSQDFDCTVTDLPRVYKRATPP